MSTYTPGCGMKTIEAAFDAEYLAGNPLELETDGLHVKLKVYVKKDVRVSSGPCGSTFIIYAVDTAAQRIGTDSDVDIIDSMLRRNLVVIVADFAHSKNAECPALEWSLHRLRYQMVNGELLLQDIFGAPQPDYHNIFIVPSGCNIDLGRVFWEIDRHCVDGTLEYITSVWNHDFRGVKADREVVWSLDKPVSPDFYMDSEDCFLGWVDREKGTFRTKVRYTIADDITHCVKPDGTPIEMKLHMHIIYPTAPADRVPVMMLASSSQSLGSANNSPNRPHLYGFLFRGYAAVIFEYGYVPMCRSDHFEYFDGWPRPGAVTGDNPTYSVNVYNEHLADSAAVRCIRYLSKTDPMFAFDADAIGVFGTSKTGHVTVMGQPGYEKLPNWRIFAGHHGETRYDNGKTHDNLWVHGGEKQPWLAYPDGTEISSTVNFTFSTAGGGKETTAAGHSPFYTVANMGEPDCGCGQMLPNMASCRAHDVPCLYLAEPYRGHDLCHGYDRRYGLDTYSALFRFAGYWLKHDPVECLYSDPRDGDEELPVSSRIKLHFTGPVSADEIKKVIIETTDTHERIECVPVPSFGKVEWEFTPMRLLAGREYRIYVPDTLKGENGLTISAPFEACFSTASEEDVHLTMIEKRCIPDKENGPVFYVENETVGIRDQYMLRFCVNNDAVNTVGLMVESNRGAFKSVRGRMRLMRRIPVCGAGAYETDVTDIMRTAEDQGTIIMKLVVLDEAGETVRPLLPGRCECDPGESAVQSIQERDGKPVLRTEYFKNNRGTYKGEAFMSTYARTASFPYLLNENGLTERDMGRRFRVEIDYFDTTSRSVRIQMDPLGVWGDFARLDMNAKRYTFDTVPGCWNTFSFETSVDNRLYWDPDMQKNELVISIMPTGDRDILPGNTECLNPLCPFDIGEIRVTEIKTAVHLSEAEPVYIIKRKLKH